MLEPSFLKPKHDYDDIRNFLSEDLKKVEEIISNKLNSEVELVDEVSKHILSSGGKRIRPIITLITSYICNYKLNKRLLLAASVEFIHTATLLHDDVIDESKLRRGGLTANDLFGNKASVLVGDFLFTKAFELMVSCKSPEVLELLSKASSVIAEGEILQLSTINNCNTSEEKYIEVIYAKTASLFSAAAEIGAILSKKEKIKRRALKNYGKNLGLAFQLIDDILDYTGNEALGKTLGDDFKEGKLTLPVIECIKKSNKEEKLFWKRTLEKLKQEDRDFNKAINLIKKYKSIELTRLKAEQYAKLAIKELEVFQNSKWKSALESLAIIAIRREK